MRVLLAAPQPFYTERGTPIAVRLLATTLCRLGHTVDLLVYPYGKDVEFPSLRLIRCARVPFVRQVGIGFSSAKLLTDVTMSAAILRLAGPGRYDVVHAVEEAIYPALAFRRRHRARVVYDMDSSLAEQLAETGRAARAFRGLLNGFENWAMRRSDQVIAVCEALAEQARAVRSPDTVHVIPDIPVSGEEESAAEDDLRETVGAGRPLALYVGNLEPYQGIDFLLEAARRLPAEDRTAIVIIGGGPQLERYRERVRRSPLEGKVHFLGPRPLAQLRAYLEQADVLLSPRTKGGNTPLKIYSYMQAGRPILATRLDTHTQVLDDRSAVLTPLEADAFANGLATLVRDEELRDRLARNARSLVEKQYSLDAYERKVDAAYRALAGHAA